MAQLSDLTGKSQSTLYAHMALLRSWGALRMRPSVKGSIIVAFPADTGEFFLDGNSLPAQLAARNLDSEKLERDSENLERDSEIPEIRRDIPRFWNKIPRIRKVPALSSPRTLGRGWKMKSHEVG